MKACTCCGLVKDASEFRPNQRMVSGLDSWCRGCHREAVRKARERHKDEYNAARRAKYKRDPCKMCGVAARAGRSWYCEPCRLARKRHKARMNELRQRRQGRPSPQERGYDARHRALRRQVAEVVEAGRAKCARCGLWIAPGEPWDLGHDDLDRSLYNGPEHRSCNRATSSHRKERERTSRRW